MIDLDAARARATRKEETTGDYQELQLLIFELCDELEQMHANQ